MTTVTLDDATTLPTLRELEDAASLVHAVLPPTPQYAWPLLAARCGTEVWVKHENHTPVGAFKVRGGIVYMDALRRARPDVVGVVTATRGNHGQSVGLAAARAGLRAAIVAPHGNSVEKNAAMRALGVELLERGHDFQAASEAADALADERGWHRVPSFHPLLVRGVGTYALELFRATPPLDAVYVPIGMGSGACGVIAARDALGLRTSVIGVTSTAAPAFARSLAAGAVVSHESTTRIADGVACRTADPTALAVVARGAERVVEVTDDEVEAAMRALFADTHNVAEGAGAAALAALLQERDRMRGRRVAVILTGGNVDTDVFARVLAA
ncbi:Pyridoxal-5'-phosphate-dependent protein beta subunit (plasmid) [Gemmatirosa kalamazoonensis]|uniref:Pyridoxal-5'-phosphate-dependent protein beta subunit n=1 Tax=Gemmatirosa kalamazoonensis TaxID=861299 RepID=W0RT74_9BACT|nr:threonine dehydratase [Gemmatirosa kalamazoonensis]AHG93672.1 Pyridoxal-5'-phosphate-dependent protein beta subunit [Gemmatirosa kalamazoonensis]